MPQKNTAFRYMVGFQCLGSDCEATCCADWGVPVDKDSFARLKQCMTEPADRADFERWILPVAEAERTPGRHAMLVLEEGGRCGFLDDKQLCSLQVRHGAEVLAEACRTFPRRLASVDTRLELSGSLGCPEISRRALFEDGATDLVPVDEEIFGEGTIRNVLRGGAEPARRLDIVRNAMYDIASASGLPLDSRMFWLGYLAQELTSIVAERGDPDALEAATAPLLLPAVGAKLHAGLASAPPTGTLGILVVFRLLQQLRAAPNSDVSPLVSRVLDSYGKVTTVDELWSAYVKRRATLSQEINDRADTFVTHYVKNFAMSMWYASFASLTSYVHSLVVRVSALRFLTLGHPDLSASSTVEDFDAVVVDATYRFTRTIEHNQQLRDAIARAANEALPSLGHLAPMLRV